MSGKNVDIVEKCAMDIFADKWVHFEPYAMKQADN
jgi:hypothetical protein